MSTRCTVHDVTTISKREISPQGYLIAPAIIGRTGVQTYTRGELELDGDPRALVRLMRTADEVFRPETVASFENGRNITDTMYRVWSESTCPTCGADERTGCYCYQADPRD